MPSRDIFRCGVVVTLLLAATQASATTYHVPGDNPTIQGALNLTSPGDSVIVSPGDYPENLTMPNGVVLVGDQGAAVTAVDGRFLAPVIACEGASGFTVQDLTLHRGYNATYPGGAGVAMNLSQGTFLGCIFVENRAGRDGGGISIVDSNATIRNCTFKDNSAPGQLDGGGVFCWRSTMLIEDCLLLENVASEGAGIAIANSSTATVRRCVIANNEATSPGHAGGGIISNTCMVIIENNTIVDNVTANAAASVALDQSSGSFERNIVANATGVGIECSGGGVTIRCNDIWNSQNVDYQGCATSPADFSADPQFCNLAELDFRLHESSPCAAAHSPAGCGLIGARDVGCGPVAIEPATWGRIKTRFAEDLRSAPRVKTPR